MKRLPNRSFDDRHALDRALAADVAATLVSAIAERGSATLVVSGGTTPVGFFELLSHKALPWAQVSVLLADERWVAADDAASNEKLVRQHLLINAARSARFIPLKTADEQPEQAASALDRQLSALGTFDLVILGMGADGHTASLFPGADTLAVGLDLQSGKQCIAVTPPCAPHRRLSMTLPRLLDSRQIFLHITGDEKRAVLAAALDGGEASALPIAALLAQHKTPLQLYFAR